MTWRQSASAMHRAAEAMDRAAAKHPHVDPENGRPIPMMDGDAAVGAAVLICYLRDMFTVTEKESFGRSELLVILEGMSRSQDIFPCGMGRLIWDIESEAEVVG